MKERPVIEYGHLRGLEGKPIGDLGLVGAYGRALDWMRRRRAWRRAIVQAIAKIKAGVRW